jgi:hypothetical protein
MKLPLSSEADKSIFSLTLMEDQMSNARIIYFALLLVAAGALLVALQFI